MSRDPVCDVEVSLVNTNNRELLRGCLRSLPGACEELAWRANVVDNASSDGSAEMVAREFPWARLVRNTARRGFSANHNQVIDRILRERSARYVLIANEDTLLEHGSVRALVRFCDERPRVGAAGPVIRGPRGRVQASFFEFPTVRAQFWSSLRPSTSPRIAREAGWLNGSCVLVRTDALREIGLLDERFFIFFEDTDLGVRLAEAGWRSAICESASILHLGHQTVSQPVLGGVMERQMLRSRYLYFRKHRGRAASVLVAALVRVALLVRAGKAIATAAIGDDREERTAAALLWNLTRYNPRTALPHETAARGRAG